ncbi:lipopolysaccharide biosynthesis protein [Candidatus Woesearchaeota archaeon]|nr:lipopolysaccharide biosynthesis protein [Candidatus Woesearchaeota archaeon]
MSKFLKNVIYMFGGKSFIFFIALVSTAIYIRKLGVEGYALLGTVLSIFYLVDKMDIPYFLSLVKFNHRLQKNNKDSFDPMFSTLYSSLIIGNIIFALLLLPLTFFLSTKVYDNPKLFPLYLIAILYFLINRTSVFLQNLIRANRTEIPIQKAVVLNNIALFLFSLLLLFVFDLGVASILFGILAGITLEFAILKKYTNKLVKYKFYFSLNLFLKAFKKYASQEYFSELTVGLIMWGGLFISTFYLDSVSLGILTVILFLVISLRGLFSPIAYHIIPIFSHEIHKKNFKKIQRTINSLTSILLLFFFLSTVFFATIGKELYIFYYGAEMEGTYLIFLFFAYAILAWRAFIPYTWVLFVANPVSHNKIFSFVTLILFVLLVPLVILKGVMGVAFAYFIACLSIPLLFVYYTNKFLGIRISNENLVYSFSGIILMIITLSIYRLDLTLNFVLSSILFFVFCLITIIINFKKMKKAYKIVNSL